MLTGWQQPQRRAFGKEGAAGNQPAGAVCKLESTTSHHHRVVFARHQNNVVSQLLPVYAALPRHSQLLQATFYITPLVLTE